MQQDKADTDVISRIKARLPGMLIVVLSKPLDPASRTLYLQDYVMGGETVIPLFSSDEALTASTEGSDLGRPLIKIERTLLANVGTGHEIYLLDPQLAGQLRFTAAELKQAFPEPFTLGDR